MARTEQDRRNRGIEKLRTMWYKANQGRDDMSLLESLIESLLITPEKIGKQGKK